jgi:hypothetical protein
LYKRDDTAPDNGNGNGDDDDEAFHEALHFLTRTAHGAAVVRRLFPTGVNSPAYIEDVARMVGRVMRARADNGDDDESDLTIGDDAENDDAESTDTICDAATEKVFSPCQTETKC